MTAVDETRARATIAAHLAAVGAADAAAVARCYAADATVRDPAGGEPVRGREAILAHFATFLTEPRAIEVVFVAVVGAHAAIHFRATPPGGPPRDVIDTMTFDADARIASMQAYAGPTGRA